MINDKINEFLRAQILRGNSNRTLSYYREMLGYFLEFCKSTGADELSHLNVEVYNDYVLYLLSRDTLNRISACTYLRAVRSFLHWCGECGYLGDWVYTVRLPKKSKSMVVPLSDEEIRKILGDFSVEYFADNFLVDGDCLRLRNFCIVMLMLDCGLRRGEVVNLMCGQVDFESRSLVVTGKGDKQRIVPMGDTVANYMQLYNRWLGRGLYCCDDLPFFVGRDGGGVTENAIRCFFQDLKKATGITRLHPHLLRHTFATNYLLNGGNLEALRLLLGHSDIQTTQRYLHLAEYMKILQKQHISLVDSLK